MSAQPEGSGVQASGPSGFAAAMATAFSQINTDGIAQAMRRLSLSIQPTERHHTMVESVTINSIQYPLEPHILTGFSRMTSSPAVERRWQRVTTGNIDVDFLYMGLCAGCAYPTWRFFDENFPVEDHVGRQYAWSKFVIDEDHDDAKVNICVYCTGRGRESMALTNRRNQPDDYNDRNTQWPEVVLDEIKARIAKKDEAFTKYAEVRPTAPAAGAYVLVKGDRFLRFESFTDKGKVKANGNSYEPEVVEVIIPLVHGTRHPLVVGLPGTGREGRKYRVVRYSNIHAVVKPANASEGTSTETVACNHLGVIAPLVNPATETTEDAAARLQYSFERLRDALHHRMVAEGVHRNWCGEFDPILDSVGLDPRTGKSVVTLTMRVEVAVGSTKPTVESLMENGWTNHFNYSNLRCTGAIIEEPSSLPMLSA